MRMTQRQKGSVSVFLAIILLTTFLFSGVIIDGGRIYAGRTIASGAGQLALNAGLSNYDTALKDAYGLIAMAKTPEEMQENLHTYFVDSLGACGLTEDDFNTALVFLKEAAEDEGSFSATHLDKTEICRGQVMEQQALDYMKYRAPITLTVGENGLFDRLSKINMKEINQTKKCTEMQTETAKAANKMQKQLEKLWEEVQKEHENYLDFHMFDQEMKKAEDAYAAATAACLILRHLQGVSAQSGEEEDMMESFKQLTATLKTYMGRGTDAASRQSAYCDAADTIYKMHGYYMALKDVQKDAFVDKYCVTEEGDESDEEDDDSEEDDSLRKYYEEMYDEYKENENYYVQTVIVDMAGKKDSDAKEGGKILSSYSEKAEKYAKQDEKVLKCIEKLRKNKKKLRKACDDWIKENKKLTDENTRKSMNKNEEVYEDFLNGDNGNDLSRMEEFINQNKNFYEEFHRRLSDEDKYDTASILSVDSGADLEAALSQGINAHGESSSTLNSLFSSDTYKSYICLLTVRKADFESSGWGNKLLKDVARSKFYAKLKEYCKSAKDKAKSYNSEMKDQINSYLQALAELFTSKDLNEIDSKINENSGMLPTTIMASGEQKNIASTSDTITEGCDLEDSDSRENMMDSATESMNADDTTLDGLAKVADLFNKGGEAVAEPIYLTEYMTDMFTCYTSDKSGEKDTSKNEWKKKDEIKSLSGYDMTKDMIYRAEAEYILWGNKNSAKANVNATKAVIFAIQLIGNMIFAFTDATMISETKEIARWFPNALVQIILRTVIPIMCALVQTVRDMVILTNGGRVVLFKNFSTYKSVDWRTYPKKPKDWDMKKDKTSSDPVALSYRDYVWILLCVRNIGEASRYKQLERTADCIQLNIGSSENLLTKKYTMLQVKANVKMNNWLVTDIFNGEGTLDTSGEYTLKYLGVQGY